jgi:hypothetical protein
VEIDPIMVETGRKIHATISPLMHMIEKSTGDGVGQIKDWDNPDDSDLQNISVAIPIMGLSISFLMPQLSGILREGVARQTEAQRIEREGLDDIPS